MCHVRKEKLFKFYKMTDSDRIRYSRLIAIGEIGKEGVERLRESTVLVVGCGALGSMAAVQLAASGVGHLKIVDFDTIDLSNLQRQFFFKTEEAGQSKVSVLSKRIASLNPDVRIEAVEGMLNRSTAMSLISGCDFVVDATDNPESMSLIDSICNEYGVNCVLAGVSGFSGQVMTCLPGKRRYSDVFPSAASQGVLPCSLTGVAGPAAAVAASVEVAEAIKSLVGADALLSDKLFVFDLLNMNFDVVNT